MITPLARPLETDNAYLRMLGGNQLAVGQSAVNQASKEAAAFGFGRKLSGVIALGNAAQRAESPITAERLTEENAYQVEAAQLAYEMQGASADELPAIRDRLKTLEGQHNVPLDNTTQQQLAMGRIQQPTVLAEKYILPGLKFDRAMSDEEAKLLYDTRKADLIRQAIIQQGPHGFVSGVQKFGNSLIGMATDPLEVATSFIPVFGEAGKAWAVARFGGLGGRVVLGAAEGGIGNAMTEPAYAALSHSQQLDYTMSDSLMNVGLGFVLGGGLGAISHVAARGAKEAPAARVEVSAPDVVARVDAPAPDAPAARAEAVKPDTLHLTEQYRVRKETMRLADEQRPVAETALRQFVNDQPVRLNEVMPRDPDNGRFVDARGMGTRFHGSVAPIDRLSNDYIGSERNFYGQGFYTSDAVSITHGYTKKSTAGQIYKISETAPIKALNMEEPVPNWFREGVKGSDIANEALGENPKTLREFYDTIRDLSPDYRLPTYEVQEIFDGFADLIRANGYNALDHMGGLRTKKAPHAVRIYLNPEGNVALNAVRLKDFEHPELALAKHAQTSDNFSDPVAAQKLAVSVPYDQVAMTDHIAGLQAQVEQLSEADLSPAQREDFAAIEAEQERFTTYAEVAQAAATCLART